MEALQAVRHDVMLSPITAATTERTANLELSNVDYAQIIVTIGAEANTNSTNVAVALLESNDTTATNFATFDADSQKTIDNASGTIYVLNINPEGRKKYVRLKLTPDTTTNGAVLSSAVAITRRDISGSPNVGGDVAGTNWCIV